MLESSLPVTLRHVPQRIRDVARELDLSVALAGGVPRDLLRIHLGQLHRDQLATELRDFDVVAAGPVDARGQGAGLRFAQALRARLRGELTVNAPFHTATLITADPLRIDITTARHEHYPSPGALPEVDVGDVELGADLARRDFSVNALALDLSDDYGRLLDLHGGSGDIADRLVRVLHSASFSDDPTRLLRAVRYSIRLGYDLEPVTRAQYQHAIDDGALDHLTPERIRYEIECIGREERWVEMWAVLDVSRLTTALSPGLGGLSRGWDLADAGALDIAIGNQPQLLRESQLEPWFVRTAWALGAVPDSFAPAVCERLGLFKRDCTWLLAQREVLRRALPRLLEPGSPSEFCRQLEKYPRQAVALALFVYQPRTQEEVTARKELKRYLDVYSQVRCELNGRDLMEMGLRPGPLVGRIRDELRYLRLDGAIKDMAGERQRATELIRELTREGNGRPLSGDLEGGAEQDAEEDRDQ